MKNKTRDTHEAMSIESFYQGTRQTLLVTRIKPGLQVYCYRTDAVYTIQEITTTGGFKDKNGIKQVRKIDGALCMSSTISYSRQAIFVTILELKHCVIFDPNDPDLSGKL